MLKGITLKELLPLIGLTFSAFIFNTSEFMPIGLLTDIAADFQMSEAQTGSIITIYAWIVMLLSLPLMIWASKFEFRKLLLGTVAVFCVSHVFSAIATNYWSLLFSRIGVAFAHSIFWSIASPLAVKVVAEKFHSLALSMLATGTSIAIIFGLPFGRIIGLHFGWRMAFMFIAVISLLILLYLAYVFPKVPANKPFTYSQLPELLHNPLLQGIYFMVFLIPTAYYTTYSYIEPFLKQIANMPDSMVTITLIIFGAFGLVGSLLFSLYYNRAPYLFLRIVSLSIAVALLLLYPLSGSYNTLIALCAFWGITITAFCVSFQAELLTCVTGSATAVAMSIFSGIFNLGIGTGSFLGGMVCTYSSLAYIGYAGGTVGMIAFIYCSFVLVKNLRMQGK